MGKIKLLLYCTKSKPTLYNVLGKYITSNYLGKDFMQDGKNQPELNGKIVAECDFEVEEIEYEEMIVDDEMRGTDIDRGYYTKSLFSYELEKKSCLSLEDLDNYLIGENGYAIHIKNLKERVMKLSDVYKYDNSYDNMFGWLAEENEKYIPLDKAPQNMCRVWVYENGRWVMYILISIRPEWMCLILNKDKDVELRKKVLKEMIS